MPATLHILTRSDDALAEEVISRQEQMEDAKKIRRFDLTSGESDYEQLLAEIFEADSVQVW